MLIPIGRLITALNHEFRKLMPRFADAGTDGSAAQAIAHGLHLLQAQQSHGVAWIEAVLADYRTLLDQIEALLGTGLEELRNRLAQGVSGALPDAWLRLAGLAEELIVAINAAPLASAQRAALCTLVVDWEEKALLAQLETSAEGAPVVDSEITRARLEAYLRDRFADPALALATFQPLAGGFGKETIIFEIAEGAHAGEYVMRRDLGKGVSLDNDCHVIDREYPVIRALRDRGFPAPEAVWLDTEHALLAGGDFIVMRRSAGTLGGSFFGAQAEIPESLADALADIAGRLHTLPPLTELGAASDFIRPEIWQLSRGEAAGRYIRGWYDYLLAEAHSPSPSLAAIYGWLLDNVPNRPGRACLVHGDIGFHNFLFDQGALSAVLDWEFAHVGDPAEELGYIRLTIGDALDWDAFMARYIAAGGEPIDPATLHFFRVWGYARNASAANIVITRFMQGVVNDLKLAVLPHYHYAKFIRYAQQLIVAGP